MLLSLQIRIKFERNEMKKKIFIIAVLVVVIGMIGIYLFTRPKVLGNMSNSSSEQITETFDVSFSGETGDRIRFSLKADITNGNLDMTVYDSAGNEVYVLDSAKELETFLTLERSDTYTLVAECNEFVGKYKISVYKLD